MKFVHASRSKSKIFRFFLYIAVPKCCFLVDWPVLPSFFLPCPWVIEWVCSEQTWLLTTPPFCSVPQQNARTIPSHCQQSKLKLSSLQTIPVHTGTSSIPEPNPSALVFQFLASSYVCWLLLLHCIRLYIFPTWFWMISLSSCTSAAHLLMKIVKFLQFSFL